MSHKLRTIITHSQTEIQRRIINVHELKNRIVKVISCTIQTLIRVGEVLLHEPKNTLNASTQGTKEQYIDQLFLYIITHCGVKLLTA